jgi:hypothetical protein
MGATAGAGVFAGGDGLIGGEVGSWRGPAPPNHPAKGRGAFGNRVLGARFLCLYAVIKPQAVTVRGIS